MIQNSSGGTLPSCSAMSILVNEQLFGTAPLTQVWIMVEYPHPFGGKALEESLIPDTLKAHLSDAQKKIPASRLLLIRQEKHKTKPGISTFVGLSSLPQPLLYEFHLANYDELLNLDLISLSSGRIELHENLRKEPLFLVCTNGKRDPCCVQWGHQVYLEMSKLEVDSVWQTSHLGGHRFAANVISLPHGIYNGRVRAGQAVSLMVDYCNDRLTPQNYRGRAHYTPEVQVAEYYLLEQTSILDINAFQLLQSVQIALNLWEIAFVSREYGTEYKLVISAHQSAFNTYESCSAPDKRGPHLQYQLERWRKS